MTRESEMEQFLRACEDEVRALPRPFYGVTEDTNAGPPKITGYVTTLEVSPSDYQSVSEAAAAAQLKALADRYGCEFRAEDGVFVIRKAPPKKTAPAKEVLELN